MLELNSGFFWGDKTMSEYKNLRRIKIIFFLFYIRFFGISQTLNLFLFKKNVAKSTHISLNINLFHWLLSAADLRSNFGEHKSASIGFVSWNVFWSNDKGSTLLVQLPAMKKNEFSKLTFEHKRWPVHTFWVLKVSTVRTIKNCSNFIVSVHS